MENDISATLILRKDPSVAIASQLFVLPETVRQTISTFLTTAVVKPCNIERPTGGGGVLYFISS